MERFILISIIVLTSIFNSFSETNWTIPKGEIIHVFELKKSKDKTEILRLYSSGEYEQLEYQNQPKKTELVKRNLGAYKLKNGKLIIKKPSYEEFKGIIVSDNYVLNKNIYPNLFSALVLRNNVILKESKESSVRRPFYIGIESNEIVSNKMIKNAFNLKDLVSYLIRDEKSEKEKVLKISQFICRSISYDFDGYYSGNYSYKQSDVFEILTGNKRVAVCAGYANIFDSLAKIANLQTKVIIGNTKTDFADLQKIQGLHAWNSVRIEGKEYLIDVTWADNYSTEKIDMKWMFVNPKIMIGTHFPDEKDDQLLENPTSVEDFVHQAIIYPSKSEIELLNYPVKAKYYTENGFIVLKFSKPVDLSIEKHPKKLLNLIYAGEKNASSTTYSPEEVYDFTTFSKNDTFNVVIPIKDLETAFEVYVANDYSIKFSVFKGSKIEYIKNLEKKWNNVNSVAYSEGILAGIYLNDINFLKEKLGEDYSLFFDKKDKCKLNKTQLKNIKEWEGITLGMNLIHSISYSQGIKVEDEIKHYVDFTNGIQFRVNSKNKQYSLASIE